MKAEKKKKKPTINKEDWASAKASSPEKPKNFLAEMAADARTLLITEDGKITSNHDFKEKHIHRFQPGNNANPAGRKGKDGKGGQSKLGIGWMRQFSREFLTSEDGQVLLLVRAYKDPLILREMMHYAFGRPVDITNMPDEDEEGGKDMVVRFVRPGADIPKELE